MEIKSRKTEVNSITKTDSPVEMLSPKDGDIGRLTFKFDDVWKHVETSSLNSDEDTSRNHCGAQKQMQE